jgi:hypothetical protein
MLQEIKMTIEEKKLIELEFANQQLTGFTHAKEGYSLKDLIISMGLKVDEWEKLKKMGISKYRPTDIVEINEYFESL